MIITVRLTDAEDIIESSVKLYNDYDLWKECVEKGREIVKQTMNLETQTKLVSRTIGESIYNIEFNRSSNPLQKLMWQETLPSIEKRVKQLSKKYQN